MKITKITLWRVPLVSHVPYIMSDGKICDSVDTIIVRVDTDTPHSGWGEMCVIPQYLPAYTDGVMPGIAELSTILIGTDPTGPEAVWHKMNAHLQGHPYVKSPVDMAIWDLNARAANLPLYALLGGKNHSLLPLYHSITSVAPDEMARMAKDAQDKGMAQFQVKLGAEGIWDLDAERMIKVREAVGPGPLVYGDWNCGSTQLDAIRTARAVQHLDVMLEQPCPTLHECAEVKRATGLAMKIDESAQGLDSVIKANELGCIDAMALKISKFGGLSAAKRVRDFSEYLGIKLCVEDTWGSDITTNAAFHLGASTRPRSVMNVCDLSGYVAPRLDEAAPTRENGAVLVSEKPGIGVDPDPEVLGQSIAIFD